MADREFEIRQTRRWNDTGTPNEHTVLGRGVDHGDGTAHVTPAEGLPWRENNDDGSPVAALVEIEDLTDGGAVGGITTELVYADQE